jgi:predicted amidohydrolase YtcJ
VGYHESVAGPLDRDFLDELVAGHPLRVQHRSGELWVLNSAGVRASGLESAPRDLPGLERDASGRPTGRLWRLDRWLRDHVPAPSIDLVAVSRAAAAAGVTGFTDAGPDTSQADADQLAGLIRDGSVCQRVALLAPLALDPPTDRAVDVIGTKVLLDDLTLPSLDELTALICESHAQGRAVAVHCVTRVQLVLTVAALSAARSAAGSPAAPGGDRIEHASVVPAELIPELRRLGATVVTQPNFVAERGGEYRATVEPADQADLYRVASLLAAGVRVAAGTDAPLGRPDVWAAVRAAVERSTPAGDVLGPEERVGGPAAVRLFLGEPRAPGRPRRLIPGAAADLCLLGVPLEAALADISGLGPERVAATIVAGRVVSRRA